MVIFFFDDMRNRFYLLMAFLLVLMNGFVNAQSVDKYRVLLTGASFASSENGWFELGCRELNGLPINRAVGGEAIANTANRMIDGSLYSFEEFDGLDAFVIMQVHDQDVFDETQLLDDFRDYRVPFDRSNYAAAFDYVIKRYINDCYELRNNPKSRYYGSKLGKPANIVLSTHWHDGRVTYNSSVRRLAEKWGLPLIEFDKNVGFSKNSLHPVTKAQHSLLFATDIQSINGVQYGFHPKRGEDKYIQKRLAAIFAKTMRGILPLK